MIEIKGNREILVPLYRDYRWNYLADAVLDGMTGRAWTDDTQTPNVGVLEFPRIQLFLPGGDPTHLTARAWLEELPKPAALVFTSDGWEAALKEAHRKGIVELPRYAFTSENLRVNHLRDLVGQVPAGYTLERLNLAEARQLAQEGSRFTADHFINFNTIDKFINQGFGFCIIHEGQIVSLATTFLVCKLGVEIQINTRDGHQRKGLATVVAARLILHCLDLNLDPNWDAAIESSVGLAEKLGYTSQGEYRMFVVTGEGGN